jgi:hypothetical protein
LTGKGSVSASDWTAAASMASSISPVGSFGLIVSAERFFRVPVKVATLSSRSASTRAKIGLELSTTHCVSP